MTIIKDGIDPGNPNREVAVASLPWTRVVELALGGEPEAIAAVLAKLNARDNIGEASDSPRDGRPLR